MPELRHPRPGPDAARGHALRPGRPRPPKEGPLIARRAPRTLVLGFGNPGRRDDGLGPAAIERLKARPLRGVTLDADYQLNLEDALACAGHDIVVFIDAARGLRKPYAFTPVAAAGASFPPLSHTLSPEAVLAVTAALYGKSPEARILAIRGRDFSIGEGLSRRAEADLDLAVIFLGAFLKGLRA